MITFTEEQAKALVTDPGTYQRGQELAKPAKWANLGRTATTAWGECAGSGAKPYLTGIDLTEPVFKCSCPSRVFPCKHGAGLLLLLARQPALLIGTTPPAWLTDWLDKRQQSQATKGKKTQAAAIAAASAANDEAAPAARPAAAPKAGAAPGGETDAKRLARMRTGADELAAWLEDLLRTGLAALDQQPATFWESQAARLVDNQLPGLAATVRELATVRHAHADWPARLLARLGKLALLVAAFRRHDRLAPAARQEVWQQVGVNLKKEDLLATTAPVTDEWQVLGQFRWEEDRLTARRTWLRGTATGRQALLLEFAFGNQAFATPLLPQGHYAGSLVFYPGLLPLRAAPVSLTFSGTAAPEAVPPAIGLGELLETYATALARLPWLREWPVTLGPVLPAPLPDGRWLLHDANEALALPLRFADDTAPWHLLAQSGGQPLTLFGEWDGQAFRPLSHWASQPTDGQPTKATNPASPTRPDGPVPAVVPAGASTPEPSSTEALPAWPQLLRLALLGTRQSGEGLPAFAALPTAEAEADSPEQQLLLAAGAVALVRQAGYVPAPAAALAPPPAPTDPQPALGAAGTECLRQMVVGSQYPDLLPAYLNRMAAAGRRVPESLLVALLHHATRSPETKRVVAPVLGTRGRWLAALHAEWASLLSGALPADADPADLTTWETAPLPERLAWLRRLFARDADAARALLLAALPTEPAKVQEALLELLADHLHPDTQPTLETLLNARGQEARRRAAELLVRQPGAALTERLWARAAPLLAVKRGRQGKITLDITLPTAWDKSWLADGIDEKNSRFQYTIKPSHAPTVGPAAIGPAAARLGHLLALVPPQRWTAHLGLTPTELLAAALASDWAVPLLPCWAQSTLLHQDADFTAALLTLWQQQRPALHKAGCQHNIDWLLLTNVLPPPTRQQLLLAPIRQRMHRQEPDWTTDLAFVPAPWPRELTTDVLDVIVSRLTNTAAPVPPANAAPAPPSHPPHELWQLPWLLTQTVASHLAPADETWVIARVEAIAEPHEVFKPQLAEFTATLRFRQQLNASLNEE